MPFYLSSGAAPKPGVVPGQWYPFFGVGRQTGWINKTPKMADYFGSPKLEKVAGLLDRDFGDLRKMPGIVETDEFPKDTLDFLNRDMREIDMLFDADGKPVEDEDGNHVVIDEHVLEQSISAFTALIEADDQEARMVAADRLVELDSESGKITGTANNFEEYSSKRREHYLSVGDPSVLSPGSIAASPEHRGERSNESNDAGQPFKS